MVETADDPGPSRICFTGGNHRMFPDIREVLNQKDDGTVGISYYVRKSSGVRRFGMVLCRMGLLLPKSCLCLSVL